MKERLKKKLTTEQVLEDYLSSRETTLTKSIAGIGCFGIFPLMIFYCFAPLFSFILTLVLSPILLFYIPKKMKERKADLDSLKASDFEITADYIADKEMDDDDSESTNYYLCFNSSGRLRVDYQHYRNAQIGERFWVGKRKGHSWFFPYPDSTWRINDPAEEQIAAELQEEDILINRIMECERFPRLTIQQQYYADTRPQLFFERNHLDSQSKMNLIERLAANHFFYCRVSAIEYVIRYCPSEIQKHVIRELSDEQINLWRLIQNRINEE